MSERAAIVDIADAIADVRSDGRSRDVRCPAHDDARASLSVGLGTDGRVLLHCHTGCATEAILEAAGLSWGDLYERPDGHGKRQIVAEYNYTAESGDLLYQVVRLEPKDFRQRRPGPNNDWVWNLGKVRRVLYRLPELRGQKVAYISEGEKDVDRLRSFGLIATCNAGGSGKWRDDYAQQLKAVGVESVVVLPDNDDPGRKHATDVARSCQDAGLHVKVVELPGLPEHGDVSDWLDAGHTRDELIARVKATALYEPPETAGAPADAVDVTFEDEHDVTGAEPIGNRPTIIATHMDLKAGTALALDALTETNDPPQLFLLGDSPVRVEPHPDDGRPVTRELTESRVVYHLAQCINWVRTTKDGQRPTLPSVPVARNILASPSLPFPSLDRIVEVPVFGRDGSLCATLGYHAGARLLYQPPAGFELPPIPPEPSDVQIAVARALICDELLVDFPFTGDAERAHAVALLLLPFVRDLIPGPTPLHSIEKPTAGTGGSLLADVLMRPSLGRALPAMTAGRDADEWRKRITAILSESPIAVLWDNVRRLDSEDLSSALTATTWKDRPLGATRIVHLPVRCAWIATANNPALNFEIVRRTVRIRLDAGIDRPWLRSGFRHPDLIAWAMAHRAELIAAALTLVQAWIARGKPVATHPQLGSYEEWSRVLGGILSTAQIPGFLGNILNFYETVVDDETQAGHALVTAWWNRYGDHAVGVKEIWQLTQGDEGIDLDLGDKGEKSQRTRLGKILGRMRDRIFNDRRVMAAGTDRRSNVQLYRLVDTDVADVSDAPPSDMGASSTPADADVADFADVSLSAPASDQGDLYVSKEENVCNVQHVCKEGSCCKGGSLQLQCRLCQRSPTYWQRDEVIQ